MKVWVLVVDVDYEGEWVEGVYATAEAGMAANPSTNKQRKWHETMEKTWHLSMNRRGTETKVLEEYEVEGGPEA